MTGPVDETLAWLLEIVQLFDQDPPPDIYSSLAISRQDDIHFIYLVYIRPDTESCKSMSLIISTGLRDVAGRELQCAAQLGAREFLRV